MPTIRVRVQDFKFHPDAVYIGRRNGFVPKGMARATEFGNPFKVRSDVPGERHRVVQMYYHHLIHRPHLLRALPKLRDKEIACWCSLDVVCHGDWIVRLLEGNSDDELLELAENVEAKRA